MTWLAQFYLRAFAILLQVACIITGDTISQKPIILVPPQALTVTAANVTVTCISSGSKPTHTVWQKDGATLDIRSLSYLRKAPDGSLHILFATRQRDEGFYRCIVSNAVGTVFSLEAHITFPFMESFSMPESEVTVNEGSRALLKCYAPKSYPDRHIYWSKYDPTHPSYPITLQSKDNTHYSKNENGDLYFSYTKTDDNAGYYCNVENHNVGRVQRRTVVLVVNPMKTQTNQPPRIWYLTRTRAIKGRKFVLECIAFGRPVPMVQLRKVGTSLSLGSRDGNSRKYVFERFTEADEGTYECEATSPFGEVDRRTTTIIMEAPPVWVTKPEEITTAIDSVVTFSCVAQGKPTVSYQWFLNGNSVPFGREYSLDGGNLTVLRVQPHHSGMYQCIAGNEHGDVTAAARLLVIEIPARFGRGSIGPMPNTHALIGKNVELSCNPTGAPRPIIRWRHKEQDLEIRTGGRFVILPNGNLEISNVRKKDEGTYECLASNRLGRASRSGRLSVRAGIAITVPPLARQFVTIEAEVNLTCGVQTASTLEVAFRWEKNGQRLRLSSRIQILADGHQMSVVRIRNTKMSDAGLYKCIAMATGAAGSGDSAVGIITVVGVPGSPTDVKVTLLRSVNAKVSWILGRDNYSPIRTVYIQYRTAFDLRTWHNLDKSEDIQSMGSKEVKLSPWASYKFRVIAENGVGNSTPSLETEKWLQTSAAAPDKYPTEIHSIGTSPTEITISWNPLPRIDQNGPGIYYIIFHRLAGSSRPMNIDEVRNGQTSFQLKGTDYYVEYQFMVQAGNDIGLGPKSPVQTGFTGERLPLGIPKDLQVQVTSSTSAVAWWRGVRGDRETIRGEFLGYKLFVWVGDRDTKPTEATYKTTRANRTTVLLQPFTSYLFQVVAYNKRGNGPGSNIVGPLRTPEDVPKRPASVFVSYAEMGKANITWTIPNKTNGVISGFILKYRELPSGITRTKLINSGAKRWTIARNLKPAAKYEFSVAASTRAGTGKPTKTTFDFMWLPTATPSDVRVSAIGIDTIVLTWSPVNRPTVIGYKVSYWQENSAKEESVMTYERGRHTLTAINSLEGGTSYYFQVSALNQYGAGPKTKPLKVTTNPSQVPASNAPEVKKTTERQKKGNNGVKTCYSSFILWLLMSLLSTLLVNR